MQTDAAKATFRLEGPEFLDSNENWKQEPR